MRPKFAIWRDRRGRLSALRIATIAVLAAPLVKALVEAQTIVYGARPLNELIHRSGYWAITFVLASLAVTPLRRVARFGQLVDVRRMIGVAAFCYAATHISLYVAEQMFDLTKVVSEITHRVYLTIGFTALLGLLVLAGTSTDGMVRRLGGHNWQRLHRAVYVIASLALVHFFQQTKADAWLPTLYAGLFAWLMSYRLLARLGRGRGELPPLALLALTAIVGLLVFAGEAIGIGIAFRVSPFLVLQAAFVFDWDMIRPGWIVIAAGLCVLVVDLVRRWGAAERQPSAARAAREAARRRAEA
jgi:sulfoxide reductase heme-binding subunit YedZ